jgi:hypothetical protein
MSFLMLEELQRRHYSEATTQRSVRHASGFVLTGTSTCGKQGFAVSMRDGFYDGRVVGDSETT